jgi:hypothetical protein
MAARLSALFAGRSLPQKDPWYLFLLEAESTQDYNAAGRIRSIEKLKDLIESRTRNLPIVA